MKIATQTITHEGNLTFDENHEMGIAEGGQGIILRSLISAYKHPYLAALREYTSNAFDAHREAGQTRPVEVTLPTALSPNLTIQDWGIGMSRAALIQYSQFGASHKRDSNDLIGGFGIGSKSGLAIASQFTVTSIKDGKRNTAVIGYKEDGMPTMGLLPEQDTTDPNGVKVTIPTTASDQFGDVAGSDTLFWLGWPEGSIRVNGRSEFPSVHDTDTFNYQKGLGWRRNSPDRSWGNRNNFRALIGAVSYRLSWDDSGLSREVPESLRLNYLSDMVIELENGSVDLTPSREELVYSKRTREAIKAKIEHAVSEASRIYQQEIDAATNLMDVLRVQHKATRSGLKPEGFTYKGQPIFDWDAAHRMGVYDTTRITLGSSSTALLGYQNDRSSTSMAAVFQNRLYNDRNDSNYYVLVTDAGFKSSASYEYHAESIQGAHFADALTRQMGLTQALHQFDIFITSKKVSELSDWEKAAFHHITDAPTFVQMGLDHRKVIQKENRTNNPATPRVKGLRVRNVTRWSGRGYKASSEMVPIESLDTTIPYIILRTEDSTSAASRALVDGLRGKSDYSSSDLSSLFSSRIGINVGVLLAASNWDTSKYADVLTITTVDEAVKTLALAARQTGLTPAQEAALYDRTTATSGEWWGRNKDFSGVKNAETRAWLEALQDNTLAHKNKASLEYEKIAQRYGITLPARVTGTTQGRAYRYPLLGNMGYSNPKASHLVEYFNMVDSVR